MIKGCLWQGDAHHRFFPILPLFTCFASFSHTEAEEKHPPSPWCHPLCCGGWPRKRKATREEKLGVKNIFGFNS